MKKSFLAAFAAVAIVTGIPAQAADAGSDARTEAYWQRVRPDIQQSVTGYFNTLNIDKSQVKQGLTIPFVTREPLDYSMGSAVAYGWAVANSRTAANNCPEFEVTVLTAPNMHVGMPYKKFSRGICP